MKFALTKLSSSVIIGLFLTGGVCHSQSVIPDDAVILNGSVANETAVSESPASLSYRASYTLNPFTVVDEKDQQVYTILPTDEATIQTRLQGLQNIMPLTYNSTVRQFIDFFMVRRPSFTRSMLEKKEFYFPVFEKYLLKYNMPDELKYLALIESGLNPKAVSRASAVGLWQFMSFTGREQGLQIDEYFDERMHIEKSTDAACRYLRTLYGMFGDWDLALAAYNSGPGTIRRALRRSGRSDYWDIHSFIPRDTRTYVPQFIAINYMMNYGQSHGISPMNPLYPIDARSFTLNGFVDLKKFAELSNIDYATIQLLNPHIKKDILPSYTRGFELKLPATSIDYVYANSQSILEQASRQIYQTPNTTLASSTVISDPNMPILNSVAPTNVISDIETTSQNNTYNQQNSDNYITYNTPTRVTSSTKQVKKYHKVRRGENLNIVADKHNVSVSELKKWNRLRSSKILVGQSLAYYTTVRTSSNEGSVSSSKSTSKKVHSAINKPIYYTVKRGDTLWSISQRYNGVSVSDIKRLNKISGNTVKVGQRLKISS